MARRLHYRINHEHPKPKNDDDETEKSNTI